MTPVNFKEVNMFFTAPPDMAEDCDTLPVYRHIDEDNMLGSYNVSCWQLDEAELAEIARTGCVWLLVVGPGQPPVALQTKNPFVICEEGGDEHGRV